MHCNKIQASTFSLRFTQFILAVVLSAAALPAISAGKSYCKWGDCKNGLGEKVYSSGNSAISNFDSGARSGYTIEIFKSGLVCESRFTKSKSNGLRYCQNSGGVRTYSYYQRNKQESGSAYLSISSNGKIYRVGRWYPSGGTSTEIIDLGRLKLDHIVVRRTGLSLVDRLPAWFSAPSDNEKYLNESAMRDFVGSEKSHAFERVEKKFAKPKKWDKCTVGDCKEGIGRYVWADGNFTIANYKDGKREGYAVYSTKSGSVECERIYKANSVTGLSACKTTHKNKPRYQFSYLVKGKRDHKDLLLITDSTGLVVSYRPGSESADTDYERLKRDYQAITSASSSEFRDQLSEGFRRISLPNKASFDSYVEAATVKTKTFPVDQFIDLAIGSEFGSGPRTIRRWEKDIKVYIFPSENIALENELSRVIQELNKLLPGIGIGRVSLQVQANMLVTLGSAKDYARFVSSDTEKRLEKNFGYFSCKVPKTTRKIRECSMYVDTERAKPGLAKHLVREEFTQSLGLMNDISYNPESIFFDKYSETSEFSPRDKQMLCFLYSEWIAPGMSESEVRKAYGKATSATKQTSYNPCDELLKKSSLKGRASQIPVNLEGGDSPKVGCEFGDCVDGFGGYVFSSGDRYIGGWKNSLRDGYGIYKNVEGSATCEWFRVDDKREGISVCLFESGRASASTYLDGEKSGDSIWWNARTGEINSLSIYVDGNFSREARIDLQKMELAWTKLKNSTYGSMRSSFLEDEFLTLKLPKDDQSRWLREREIARASKNQRIPKEAKVKLGCLSGDCENGFGELATRNSTVVGNFLNGKAGGYVLLTNSEKQCEARMHNGSHNGVEHCVSLVNGNHTFSEKRGSALDGIEVTYTEGGSLIEYAVYEMGVRQSFSFPSQRDKERLATMEFEFLLEALSKLKRTQDGKIVAYKVAALDKLPIVSSDRPKSELAKRTASSKTQPTVERAAKKPKKQEVTRQRESRVADEASSPRKPKSNLQKLAYIVAELNAGSRQINANYRLDRARIDPKAFELVYEFTTMKPISELDTSVITLANQTAYCSSSKLKPFRDERMPARWLYIDSEGQKYEVLTDVSNCK